jgi:hypothetical protein
LSCQKELPSGNSFLDSYFETNAKNPAEIRGFSRIFYLNSRLVPAQEEVKGLANAPHDGRLNLFFVLDGNLTKVLNALRLNDAPWQGFWSTKNRFFTPSVKAPLMASPSPSS